VFSVGSAPKLYNENLTRVEYFHLSTASRRRRRKGNPVPGGIIGPPCSLRIYIQGPGLPGWASLESKTLKCGPESRGTRPWELLSWRGTAATVNDTNILSSERVLHKDYNRKFSVWKKKCSWVSRGLSPRRTVWRQTASRKVTLTLTLTRIEIGSSSGDGSRRWLRRNGKKGISLWQEDFTCDLKWQRDCDKSVARIRLVKTEDPNACTTVNCKVCRRAIAQ
jgi:hypothetical protein